MLWNCARWAAPVATGPAHLFLRGKSDGIASWLTMKNRLDAMWVLGIPTEFHAYDGLPKGFGLGTGIIAEVWIEDAAAFREAEMDEVR